MIALGVVALIPLIAWFVFSRLSFSGEDSDTILWTVERGEFVHDITESGNVESGNNEEIRCEVEAKGGGGSTILWILPEGTTVKGHIYRKEGDTVHVGNIIDDEVVEEGDARVGDVVKPDEKVIEKLGDIVVKLDSSALEKDKVNQEIICNQSNANVIQAKNVYDTAVLKKKEYFGEDEIKAANAGVVKFERMKIVPNDEGKREVHTPNTEILIVDSEGRELEKYEVPAGTIVSVEDNDVIKPGTVLCERLGGITEMEIKAKKAGVVKLNRMRVVPNDEGKREARTLNGEILVLDPEGRELEKHEVRGGAIVPVEENQEVKPGIVLCERVPGTYEVDEQTIEHEIIVAHEELDRAEDYLKYSTKMALKGYVTALKLRADSFDVEKARNTLASAKTRLKVLQKFTKRMKEGELDADIKTAEAKLKAEKASHELDLKELKRAEEQVEKCIIRSPQDGQVVYANVSRRHGSDTVIAEGEKVRENQVIIRLPDPTQMQVDCKISEAKVTLVEEGMPATIQLDAFPEMKLHGEVEMVNELPEPTGWFSTGAKEYKTLVRVDNPPKNLRPGLTAQVNIRVEQMPDALQVPAQALFEHGGKYYCLTEKKGKFQAHEVEIGSTNDEFVVIEEGLEEGQEIVLHSAAHREEAEGLPEVAEEEKTPKPGAPPKQPSPPGQRGQGAPREGKPPHGGAAPGGPPPGGPAEKKPGRPKPGGPGGDPFARFDKNGNSKLEQSEVPARFWSMLKTADKDGDGAIDRAEMNAAMSKMRQGGGGPQGAGGGPGARPGAKP